MAAIDFKAMSKQDLGTFRRNAMKAGLRPSVKNNYLTTKFNADLTNKQPAEWVPTELFKDWCEHHGPSNHGTADCRDANRAKAKLASKPKAKVDYQAMLLFSRIEERILIARKMQHRREKKAAKLRELAGNNRSSPKKQQ